MTDIEERCIGIACNSIAEDLIIIITSYLIRSGSSVINRCMTDHEVQFSADRIKKEGLFIDAAKKLLTEYQNQFKKFNS